MPTQLFTDYEDPNALPWDLQEFVDANSGRKAPDTPEQIAQQQAYWDRYGVKDENGNQIPGMINQDLFRQDYEALRNKYGEGTFLSNFLSVAAPLVMLAVPGIGQMIGSTITGALGIGASTAVNGLIGNTVINTVLNGGNLEKAVKSSVGQWAGTEVGTLVGQSAANMFGSADAGKFIGNLASAGTRAAITGQDISSALTGAAAQGAVDFATSKIPGFADLKPAVKNVITTSISTALQGGKVDITKMLENATKEGFISYGLSQIPDFDKADPKAQSFITTMLRTTINNGSLTQEAMNWAINQAAGEFKKSVNVAPALEELNKAGFVSSNNYFDLNADQKALVDQFADAKDSRTSAINYINKNSTTQEEIENYYKQITGEKTIPDDVKDLLKTYQGSRLDEETAFTGLRNQLDAMRAADQEKISQLNTGFANLQYDDRALANTMRDWGITPAFIEKVTGKKYQDVLDSLNARVMHEDEVAANFKDVFGRDASQAEIDKYKGMNAYTAKPQMQADADLEATTFNAKDFTDPKEASKAAKAAGYNNFVMPDGKTYLVQTPAEEGQAKDEIKNAQTFGEAFAQAREKLGSGKTFEWNGKLYSTYTAEEAPYNGSRAASKADAALLAHQAGKDLFTFEGKTYKIPAGALDNIGNQTLAETKRLLGDQVKYATDAELAASGLQAKSLTPKLGDQDTVSGKIANLFGIGAKALGEQMQNWSNAYSTATGSSYDTSLSKLGQSIENIGDALIGRDIVKEKQNIQNTLDSLKDKTWSEVGPEVWKSIKDNKGGWLATVLGEGYQEIVPTAAGLGVGRLVSGLLGAGAKAAFLGGSSAGAIASAGIDSIEAFGSGGKEAYDLVLKTLPANATAEEAAEVTQRAQDAAIKNGTIHALVEFPSEFIADKLALKHYVDNFVKEGLGSLAAKYASAGTAGFLSEMLAGMSQNLSNKYTTSAAPLTEQDWKSAFGAGLYEGSIGVGVSGGMLAPAAVRDATIIGKDFAGNNVTFGDFISGAKTVDLSTLDPNAVVATNKNGDAVTLAGLTINAAGANVLPNDLKAILPASLTTENATVVGKDSGGNDITYGDIASGKVQGSDAAKASIISDYVSAGRPVTSTAVTTPKTAITNIVSKNPALSTSDVQNIVDLTLSQVPAGITAAQVSNIVNTAISNLPAGATFADVQSAITTATQNFATKTDIENAIAGIQFPSTLKKEDVVSAIQDYMKANPGLSIADVSSKITDATKGLVTSADVKTSISDALKNYATKSDIDAAIAGIQFPAGLKKEDVTAAIQDYMKANPGLSIADVASKITEATSGLATSAEVRSSISDALKGVATKADIDAAIAGIQFPAGLTKADVAQSIQDYMKANPGLNAADVAKEIAAYMKANPAVTSADVATAISAAGTEYQGKLDQLQTDILAQVAKNEAAGMSRDAALQKAIDTVAANQKTSTSSILAKLNTTSANLNTKITNLQADLAQTEQDILAEVAKNEAAGMDRDLALQKAIDKVAATQKTSTATLTNRISGLETNLGKEIKTQVANLDAKLSAEIQAAVDAGLEGDAALQKGIDSLAAKMGVNQKTLLDTLNKSTATLKTEFSNKLTSLDAKLTAAIADAKASGLKGDAALQAAISKVAADQKTSSADLLARLGKTEASLKSQFSSEITGVKADIASLNTSLSAAIAEAKAAGLTGDAALQAAIDKVSGDLGATKADVLSALGKTEETLRSDFATQIGGVKADIAGVKTELQTAIDAAVASGLQGDAALQAAINKVAANLGTTSENLLSQIGTTAAQLKTDFATQLGGVKEEIAGVKKTIQEQYDALTASQKAEVDARVKQGKTLENAIAETQAAITTKLTDIDARIAQLRQEGLDQNTATRMALDEFKGTVSTGFSDVDKRIADLMSQGQTYQQATTNALKDLGGTVTGLQAAQQQAAAAQQQAAEKAAFDTAVQKAMNLVGAPQAATVTAAAPEKVSPLKQITTGGAMATFAGPLQEYFKTVQSGYSPQTTQQPQQTMQPSYFNYGQTSDIGQILGTEEESDTQYAASGGLMSTPLMAAGGGTRYGQYAGGGLNVVHHSGKARVDFRHGDAVTGPGDGQSDDIPAMLADGEFVFPADVVAALGNGSTKAGSDKLYDMMHSIRAYHRSAKPKDLPPPAKKSPLDYLKKGRS